MLIFKGLFTIFILIVAALSSTPAMTTLPGERNNLKPKTPTKRKTTTNNLSKPNQSVTDSQKSAKRYDSSQNKLHDVVYRLNKPHIYTSIVFVFVICS